MEVLWFKFHWKNCQQKIPVSNWHEPFPPTHPTLEPASGFCTKRSAILTHYCMVSCTAPPAGEAQPELSVTLYQVSVKSLPWWDLVPHAVCAFPKPSFSQKEHANMGVLLLPQAPVPPLHGLPCRWHCGSIWDPQSRQEPLHPPLPALSPALTSFPWPTFYLGFFFPPREIIYHRDCQRLINIPPRINLFI